MTGPMGARLDVAGVEAADLGHDLGRELVAERELLRRGQPRGDDGALLARQVQRHQAGLLLEHQPVARDLAAMANARPRQHEGGADIGMAGERHLGLGREDADVGGVRRVLGRQHEGRLGEVEFGRDRLHLLGRKALASVMTASGLPPNLRSVKTSTVMKSSFMISNLPRPAKLRRMTNAHAAPQISYDHGVSDKKLIGETIGAFFDRTVETYRDREALVVRHQNVRWTLGRARPAGRRSRGRPAVAGAGARRSRRHLVAQPLRMDPGAVRHRQGGAGAGQRQPGLPARRARVRHEQGRVQGADPGAGAQDLELSRDRVGPGEGGQAAASQARRAAGRREDAGHAELRRCRRRRRQCREDEARRARAQAAVRRRHQHPVHLGHDRASRRAPRSAITTS